MKIKMCGEKQRYTIRARNDRFVIATKPFNAQNTFVYWIADLKLGIRGPLNAVFGTTYELDQPGEAEKQLAELGATWHVSHRNNKELTERERLLLTNVEDLEADDLRKLTRILRNDL